MDFLKDLNEQQLKAVTAPLGPVLVLAGAGSGKTRALTYRIAYLIKSGQFLPANILAVTFTNKAAAEMSERVGDLLGYATGAETGGFWRHDRPVSGTFHSICARILRREIHRLKPFTSSFAIFDSDDSLRAVKQIIKSLNLSEEVSPQQALSLISAVKNRQIELAAIQEEKYVTLYHAYTKLLAEVNALDFDDLLLLTVKLFSQHKSVLSKYQNLWLYVLIDEYQDTNGLQYELIKLLVGDQQNIFAVGDDAQSIYGFRGANYKNILNFEKDFPQAQVIALEQNYRSTQNILSAANHVIKLSPSQKKKNLWTTNGDGGKLVRHTAIDEVAEAMFVAREILALTSDEAKESSDELNYVPEFDYGEGEFSILDRVQSVQGGNKSFRLNRNFLAKQPLFNNSVLKEIAVLYRTNAQSRALEEIMLRFGIPYHLVGSVRFYERKEIKDVLSYLRLLSNPKDVLSLERAVNTPPRGIGEKSFELIRAGLFDQLSGRAQNSWQDFIRKMEGIRSTPADKLLVDIIRLVLARFDLEQFYRDGTGEGEDRWENIKELLTVAARFNNLNWREALEEFLAEIALYSATDEVGDKQGITLMTLHQAKGLEFDYVFIVGLEEGLLPHMKSLEPGSDLAEEIRLAYVGFTRARKNLYLLNTHTRRIFGSNLTLKPSRVLKVIPDELIEWKE